jgi:hypothetical protein
MQLSNWIPLKRTNPDSRTTSNTIVVFAPSMTIRFEKIGTSVGPSTCANSYVLTTALSVPTHKWEPSVSRDRNPSGFSAVDFGTYRSKPHPRLRMSRTRLGLLRIDFIDVVAGEGHHGCAELGTGSLRVLNRHTVNGDDVAIEIDQRNRE